LGIAQVTDPQAVLSAIAEYDRGPQVFLKKYRKGKARNYHLIFKGQSYPSKAILAGAFFHQIGSKIGKMEGGLGVKRQLEWLGFNVRTDGEIEAIKFHPRTNRIESVDAWVDVMARTISQTVRNSNGQLVTRRIKLKKSDMGAIELKAHLKRLMLESGCKCALTGIPFEFPESPGSNPNFYPSPDRINSGGHYVKSNLQLVCRFANFWKSNGNNDEFLELIEAIRTSGT
tara:strand:+ start:371 stop:1057 length:687 start_codon:yes stop_codon:yes gene_type:complete